MSAISDEMLMAYADDELDATQRAEVEAALRQSGELRARLQVFDDTGRKLGRLFDDIMEAPVPAHLLAQVRGRPDGKKVVSFEETRQGALASSRRSQDRGGGAKSAFDRFYRYALVASVAAIVIGFASTLWKQPLHTGAQGLPGVAVLEGGVRIADKGLAGALDSAASGSVSLRDSDGVRLAVRPVLSFKANSEQYCRQYVIEAGAPAKAFAGVACREADGRWKIERQVALEKAPRVEKGIAPAAGDGVPEIEATVDRLIDGDVLGGEDERRLIGNGWRLPTSQN